jgi:Holliday junction resolvase-like predicted endonuclease
LVKFPLPAGLARAHRRNRGKSMTDQQAVGFVEHKRQQRLLRTVKAYLESGS